MTMTSHSEAYERHAEAESLILQAICLLFVVHAIRMSFHRPSASQAKTNQNSPFHLIGCGVKCQSSQHPRILGGTRTDGALI